MLQVTGREDIRSVCRSWRQSGRRIALVPTMGNIHDGHLSLVEAARSSADRVVVSVYVNPTQFNDDGDFERYPRTIDKDLGLLREAGCDLVFSPDTETMYPAGTDEAVRVSASPALSSRLEGRYRPGHFDGVVTVVTRLFNLVDPDVAVFGEKDYQQLLIIQRLVEDLGYDIDIQAVPTVREPGGLALSSRNRLLQENQRCSAQMINRVLDEIATSLETNGADLDQLEHSAEDQLSQMGFRVDYVAIRRADNLERPGLADRELRVLAAAWSGEIRLIDNVSVIRVGNNDI